MSWSMNGLGPVDAESVESFLETAQPYGEPTPQVQEQVDAAKAAAVALIKSGSVGDRPVVMHLAGHANPEHQPTEGFANDCVSVSIYQQ